MASQQPDASPPPAAPALSAAERKALRALGHHLDPVVMIGDAGLSAAVLAEAARALNAHELIKIRVLGDDRQARAQMMADLCAALGCAPVQSIGKLLLVWRPRPAEASGREAFRPKMQAGQLAERQPARAPLAASAPRRRTSPAPATPAATGPGARKPAARRDAEPGRPSNRTRSEARPTRTVRGDEESRPRRPATDSRARPAAARPAAARPTTARPTTARPSTAKPRSVGTSARGASLKAGTGARGAPSAQGKPRAQTGAGKPRSASPAAGAGRPASKRPATKRRTHS